MGQVRHRNECRPIPKANRRIVNSAAILPRFVGMVSEC